MPETNEKTSKVEAATSSVPKKALWWAIGALALITVIVVIVIMVTKKTSASEAVSMVVDHMNNQISKADLEAKIKMAEAEKLEASKIEELKKLREIKDVHERNRKLADIL